MMTVGKYCVLCFRNGVARNINKWKRAYSTDRQLTNSEVRKKRNTLFDEEKARQLSLIKRIEKIQVEHVGPPENCTLIMNKDLSTPYNCAMHIGELLMKRSVLALVNGQPWDMHRPLQEDCKLEFLHLKDKDPRLANKTFWKSCSFILGHILETAFKDQYYVELVSFPRPDVSRGSFVYDVDLNITDWKPTQMELNCLSREGSKLRYQDLKFEPLDIDASLAETMFEDNKYKQKQVQNIAAKSQSGNTVTVYRMGEHIDMSSGPLMSNTSQIGRYSVTAVHDIKSPQHGEIQRVQGLATTTDITMHWWTYEYLQEAAKDLNTISLDDSLGRQKSSLKHAQAS